MNFTFCVKHCIRALPGAKPDKWDATNPTEHLLPEAAPSRCLGCRTETPSAGFWLSALVRPENTEQN